MWFSESIFMASVVFHGWSLSHPNSIICCHCFQDLDKMCSYQSLCSNAIFFSTMFTHNFTSYNRFDSIAANTRIFKCFRIKTTVLSTFLSMCYVVVHFGHLIYSICWLLLETFQVLWMINILITLHIKNSLELHRKCLLRHLSSKLQM